MNQMMQLLMNQLKAKNPQLLQKVEQLRANQNNPVEVFKQVTSGYSQGQMDNFFNQAKNMGFGEDLINQLRNGVDTK